MAFMASWITFSEEKILKAVLSSQLSVLSSQFSVLGSRFSVLGSQFSVLSSQFSEKRTLRGTGCQRSWRKAFDLTENGTENCSPASATLARPRKEPFVMAEK